MKDFNRTFIKNYLHGNKNAGKKIITRESHKKVYKLLTENPAKHFIASTKTSMTAFDFFFIVSLELKLLCIKAYLLTLNFRSSMLFEV